MTIEEAFKHYREHGFPLNRLSLHADGGKILSLIERPCSSSGRKRWWTAGAAIGVCHAGRFSHLQPAGRWRVNGITTAAIGNGVAEPWKKPTPFLIGSA